MIVTEYMATYHEAGKKFRAPNGGWKFFKAVSGGRPGEQTADKTDGVIVLWQRNADAAPKVE